MVVHYRKNSAFVLLAGYAYSQSTLARSFSDSLDNAFLMSPEIETLSQSVAQKYVYGQCGHCIAY